MTEKKEEQALDELIMVNTKREDFVEMVADRLSPDEKQNLGENAADKVVESMAYLGAFAPEPATFDKGAFLATAGFGLEEKEVDTVWDFLKRTGALKDRADVNSGRVSVSEKFVEMLRDASNGFMTEE